jgi:SpoIID/LytB domain protein
MRTVRGGAVALLVAAVVVVAFAGRVEARPQAARAATALVISGHGFGHGVGLSQWGAEQRARAGQTYDRILSFYYPGAVLGTVPTATTAVRVLVAERGRLRLGSSSAFTVRDAGGHVVALPGGLQPVTVDGVLGDERLTLPLRVSPGRSPLQVEGTRYPGSLTLRREGAQLQAIVMLPLERYLVGVVSSECFGYWPQQALRAQAVASRTYALANLNPAAPFDLYHDDRSQNYHGLARDFSSAAAAVAATAGSVLLYGERPIQAFFSASNGGLTRAADEAWGGTSLPYLVSRSDPYDAGSPVHDWGPVQVTVQQLRSAFPELPAQIVGAGVKLTPAKRAAAVTLSAADGSRYEIPGSTFQQRLGLRSTYFTLATRSAAS